MIGWSELIQSLKDSSEIKIAHEEDIKVFKSFFIKRDGKYLVRRDINYREYEKVKGKLTPFTKRYINFWFKKYEDIEPDIQNISIFYSKEIENFLLKEALSKGEVKNGILSKAKLKKLELFKIKIISILFMFERDKDLEKRLYSVYNLMQKTTITNSELLYTIDAIENYFTLEKFSAIDIKWIDIEKEIKESIIEFLSLDELSKKDKSILKTYIDNISFSNYSFIFKIKEIDAKNFILKDLIKKGNFLGIQKSSIIGSPSNWISPTEEENFKTRDLIKEKKDSLNFEKATLDIIKSYPYSNIATSVSGPNSVKKEEDPLDLKKPISNIVKGYLSHSKAASAFGPEDSAKKEEDSLDLEEAALDIVKNYPHLNIAISTFGLNSVKKEEDSLDKEDTPYVTKSQLENHLNYANK